MLLSNKNAVIYGAAGAIGGVVARAFVREGARVFLTGRTIYSLETVAADIRKTGGSGEVAQVDALDMTSVEMHADLMTHKWGSIDISFNAISYNDIHGKPLVEMSQEDFTLPIKTAMKTQFVTTTVAARHMIKNGSGVILGPNRSGGTQTLSECGWMGSDLRGGRRTIKTTCCRIGSHGIRVICMRSAGSPDAPGVDQIFHEHAAKTGISRQAFEDRIAEKTMLKRLPKISETASAAVLMASDHASAITGAMTNLTCGEIVD